MLELDSRASAGRTSGARLRRTPMPTLTPNQQMVYEKLRELDRATGAYELLDALRDQGVNAAPTIYRALRELEGKGLVRHLVATRQFTALRWPQPTSLGAVMLVCEQCQEVVPLADQGITAQLTDAAAEAGFKVRACHLELVATCSHCQSGEGPG